jgi:hypothetical protein
MASADSSNDRHQAQHLMTALQSCKSAHRPRWLSTDHGSARSGIQLASQIVRQFIMSDAIHRPFISHFTVANLLGRLDPDQKSLPRLSNLHSACGTALRSPSAVSSLGGFRTPAAELAVPSLMRPASETLHKTEIAADHCSPTAPLLA